MIEDTAILLFAQSPHTEATTKWIHLARTRGVALSQRLTTQALHTAHATGLPVYHCSESEQRGATFGERLDHCVAAILADHQSVIIIGNDCPGLDTTVLTAAARELTRNDVVLGPDRRGGVYLIGISRAAYDRVDLLDVEWQTRHVITDLIDNVRNAYTVLQPLTDLNHRVDSTTCQKYGEISHQDYLELLALLTVSAPISTQQSDATSYQAAPVADSRGPPVFA